MNHETGNRERSFSPSDEPPRKRQRRDRGDGQQTASSYPTRLFDGSRATRTGIGGHHREGSSSPSSMDQVREMSQKIMSKPGEASTTHDAPQDSISQADVPSSSRVNKGEGHAETDSSQDTKDTLEARKQILAELDLRQKEAIKELMKNLSICDDYGSLRNPDGKTDFDPSQIQDYENSTPTHYVQETDQLKAARKEAQEKFASINSDQKLELSITKQVYEKANRLIHTNDKWNGWPQNEVRQHIINNDLTNDEQVQYELEQICLKEYNIKCLESYNKRYRSEITPSEDDGKRRYMIDTMVHDYEDPCYKNKFCITDGLIEGHGNYRRRPNIKDWEDTSTTEGQCDEESPYKKTRPLHWNEILHAQIAIVERVSGKKFDLKSLHGKRIVNPETLEIISQITQNSHEVTIKAGTPDYDKLQKGPVITGKTYLALRNCNKFLTKIDLLPNNSNDDDKRIKGTDERMYLTHDIKYYFE